MARSSGSASTVVLPGGRVEAGGVGYLVDPDEAGYRLQFERADTDVKGERRLSWFVGSGAVGRSFLSSLDGFLFQSPVSFYASEQKWDISPGFQRSDHVNLTRAVEVGCLNCHASGIQTLAGTQNGYRNPPFREGGIGCESCHGPGSEHVAAQGKGHIVNPNKLSGERRDSICAQCHLDGVVRIARNVPVGNQYRPGELLSNYSAFFIYDDALPSPMSVTSHFERFVSSKCRRVSGDKMWCGSCHDPHEAPAPENRAAYYRARCETCHTVNDCKAGSLERDRNGDDCTACHMPKSGVRDAQHTEYTDHSIRRQPMRTGPGISGGVLRSFWKNGANGRDTGLAYAALRDKRAGELLENATKRDSKDIAVLRQLAAIYDTRGETANATALYERLLTLDPSQVTAAINLGVLYAAQGRLADAMRFWRQALACNPGLTGTRLNLAVAQYQTGDKDGASRSLEEALKIDPDNVMARTLSGKLKSQP